MSAIKESIPCQEKRDISVSELKDVAIYLEGMYQGKGNIIPLGKVHLENLWNVIHEYNRKK